MWRQYAQQSTQLSVLKTYDVVLTHSAHIREEMTSHGVAADVVAYPVPASSTRAVGDPARWRLLFAARMTRLKGGEYLLDALPEVAAALDRPVDVVLAGDGPERSRLERRAGEIAARCPPVSIEFVGWATQEHLASLLGATDLLVVPSLWPEPFGAVGPFAARHGIPAAAFDVGGITEWLGDGVGGHLAPGNPPRPAGLAAAIVRCLADPVHHAELKRGALEGSVRFTMERHLAGLMPALQRAANAHRGQ